MKNNKTAKEMFEELGYTLKKPLFDTDLRYEKDIAKDLILKSLPMYKSITFCKDEKYIYVNKDFSLEELQAINKQVEELGWK